MARGDARFMQSNAVALQASFITALSAQLLSILVSVSSSLQYMSPFDVKSFTAIVNVFRSYRS